MIRSIHGWFQALSQREKILVRILAVLLAATVAFYGIIRPFYNAMQSAEIFYETAVERQVRIEAKVAALTRPMDAAIKPIAGPIDVFVSQSAGETGFAVGKLDPQPEGRIEMVIESATPTALFGWLSQLEARGIVVEALTVRPAVNETVTANLTLRSIAAK